MRGMFDLLRKYAVNPIADQMKLWDMLVFDYLIGNTDSHIKNFSLLYSPDQRSLRLAPAYDMISTTVYEQSTRDMSIFSGGVLSLDELSREAFQRAAREIGLGERMAMRRFETMCEVFRTALHQSALELLIEGFPKALAIEQRILETGGIQHEMK